ncbi:MAG: hypothetical protein IJ426_01805 [Clostridia bacterium]|nr:hypothetical protein [Clostridia bacterium]
MAEALKEHYNLYYILLEDKQKHPPPADRKAAAWEEILKLINKQNSLS